jgi:hypothetical protein
MNRLLVLGMILAMTAGVAVAAPPTVPELLRSVPADARAVIAINASALRAHPAVQKWLLAHGNWAPLEGEPNRFLTEAGLDVVRDVDAMVVALVPDGHPGRPVVFFSGRFDQAAIAAALAKRGATAFTIANVPALRLPDSEHASSSAVLAQPTSELIVAGDETAVSEALAGQPGTNELVKNAMASGQIDPKAPFWLVADLPTRAADAAPAAAQATGHDGARALHDALMASGAVRCVAVQAHLDDALHLSGVVIVDTAENAELVRDAVKGALAALRLHAQDAAPELVDVLRGVHVNLSGNEVRADGAIPVALIEKLAAEHHACTGHQEKQ